MKFELWLHGKNEAYISQGITIYEKRFRRYIQFEIKYIEGGRKGKTPDLVKAAESKLIMSKLEERDYLIILDEGGKEYSSEKFAALVGHIMAGGTKKVIFLIGGAYGVDAALKARAAATLSLSKMTFSHQIARLVFAEQLYRAFTIINREPYHHS